jgi:hypothetical protein
MTKRHEPLNQTISVFKDAGLDPRVERGKHFKVKADRLMAVVSATPSDRRAAIKARGVARRLVEGRHAEAESEAGQAVGRPEVSQPSEVKEVSHAALLVRQRAEEKEREKERRRRVAEEARRADRKKAEQEALERARLQAEI